MRFLIFNDSGRAVRISTAQMERLWSGNEGLAQFAGKELKALEVIVEVERRRLVGVVRVMPYRTRFDAKGRVDKKWFRARMERAFSGDPASVDEAISRLQSDASYFWEPTAEQWKQVADLLDVRVTDLKRRWRLPPE